MSIARQVVTNKLNVLHSKAPWVCRNDTVMGGRSFSQNFYDEGTETRVFTGTVSLENNGGFCSSWISMQPSIDMSEYEGLYVDAVALEESTFRLMMRDEKCGNSGIYFCHNFQASPVGSPSFHRTYIPFSKFECMWRGQHVDREPVIKNNILQFGLMAIKTFVVGEYELYIKEIGGYNRR